MPTADLSVVMANRNHARHLPRALDAVLSQSVRPREVIVLDDDSSDESVRVLEGYCRRFPIVRLIRNESQLGVTATYNRGFALATGRYLLHIAADDYLLPGFIAKAIGQFRLHPYAGVCVANGSCTEGDRGPLIENDPGWCERPTYFSPEELCRRLWHTLPVSAIIIRRDAALAAGGFLPQLCLVLGLVHGSRRCLPVRSDPHPRDPRHPCRASKLILGERPLRPEHIRVLGALLDCLTSPKYADVAPYFRRNGAACHFGPDLFRAAALRTDRFEPAILGLLTGFAPGVYEQIAQDDDPTVRQLAAVFLQDPWRELIARRADLEAENRRLVEEIQLTRLRAAPPGPLESSAGPRDSFDADSGRRSDFTPRADSAEFARTRHRDRRPPRNSMSARDTFAASSCACSAPRGAATSARRSRASTSCACSTTTCSASTPQPEVARPRPLHPEQGPRLPRALRDPRRQGLLPGTGTRPVLRRGRHPRRPPGRQQGAGRRGQHRRARPRSVHRPRHGAPPADREVRRRVCS